MAPHLAGPVRELIIYWRNVKGIPVETIADLARCNIRTVYKVLERYEESGTPHARPRGNRPEAFEDDDLRYLLSLLQAQPSLYLDELRDRLEAARGTTVCLSTICRALYRTGWTRKAASRQAAERDELLRSVWQAEHAHIPPECFVWLDESGVDDDSFHRRMGQAPEGRVPVLSESFGGGERVTMLPALCSEGIIAMDILEGGVNKERFVDFLRRHLVRNLVWMCPANQI